MTLVEVADLRTGDKIFAYETSKMDILNLEIVSTNYNNNKIICKNDTQYYSLSYYLYDSFGRTFEECLYNNIKNYSLSRKSNLEEKHSKKYPEYFI